jgi:signal transduction histidine kinase
MMGLRPPVLDERGLVQALHDHVLAFTHRTSIPCELDIDEVFLDKETETIMYRIAQEALTNVANHSKAKHAIVRCGSRNGRVEMEISDDGVGFDPSATDLSGMDGHLGLASIRERIEFAGGSWSLDSAIGKGTRVSVSLDLHHMEKVNHPSVSSLPAP